MQRRVPLSKPDLPEFGTVADQLRAVIEDGPVSNFGPRVTQFEAALGRYLGTAAVTTASGTQGLVLALQALGLTRGARVIVPSFTSVASAQAILNAGGRLLFADIGEDLTVDSLDLATLLDQNVDAAFVLPVHTHGLPCDTVAIERVVQAFSSAARPIRTVYDSAQALGAQRDGEAVGRFGDAEVFSLSSDAPVVAAEGGVVTTRSQELLEKMRVLRNNAPGADSQAAPPAAGGRLSELHAVLGLANLATLEVRLEQRQILARRYAARIHERTDFRATGWPAGARATFARFTVLVPDALTARREQVIMRLAERGVETAAASPPLHEQRWLRSHADRPLPRTESLARRALELPFFTALSNDDMDHVIECLRNVRKELS